MMRTIYIRSLLQTPTLLPPSLPLPSPQFDELNQNDIITKDVLDEAWWPHWTGLR